jgi:hypothetical protein
MLMSSLVFKRPCARCPAVAEVPISFEQVKKGVDPAKDKSRRIVVQIGGKTIVEHDHLCDACQEICAKYIANIGKKLEKKASVRERAPAEPAEE